MCTHDRLADFLTRLRNASSANHKYVDVSYSNLIFDIAQLLEKEGFIEHVLCKKDEHGKGTVRLFLRYVGRKKPLIRGIRKISKQGKRKYVGHDRVPQVFNGLGIAVVSTSQGVLEGKDAFKKKVGGELLCYVW